MATFEGLNGLRVLVVEDDPLIGMLVEDILLDCGCVVSGPHITLAGGLDAARLEPVDLAVLDVNLAGQMSYPVAEVLAERRIPFLFTSGYGEGATPPDHPEWPICSKPFTFESLTKALRALLTEP